jgi:hypothetical protein
MVLSASFHLKELHASGRGSHSLLRLKHFPALVCDPVAVGRSAVFDELEPQECLKHAARAHLVWFAAVRSPCAQANGFMHGERILDTFRDRKPE